MPSDQLAAWMSVLANAAAFLGIPVGIFLFLRDRRREREDRELSAFTTLNSLYVDYLRLCLDRPHVAAVEADVGDAARDQDLLLHIVVSILESAFLLYRDQRTAFRSAQWAGWNDYVRLWCAHPEFKKRWPDVIEQYDHAFVAHVRQIYGQVNPERDA